MMSLLTMHRDISLGYEKDEYELKKNYILH